MLLRLFWYVVRVDSALLELLSFFLAYVEKLGIFRVLLIPLRKGCFSFFGIKNCLTSNYAFGTIIIGGF